MGLIVVGLALLLITPAQTYPHGAGVLACWDLFPCHGVPKQWSPSPYRLEVDKIAMNKSNILVVKVTGDIPFRGFMIQIKNKKGLPEGSFDLNEHTNLLDCEHREDTATHLDRSLKDAAYLVWRPSKASTAGLIRAYGSVLMNATTFWAPLKSRKIVILNRYEDLPKGVAPDFISFESGDPYMKDRVLVNMSLGQTRRPGWDRRSHLYYKAPTIPSMPGDAKTALTKVGVKVVKQTKRLNKKQQDQLARKMKREGAKKRKQQKQRARKKKP